MHAQSVPEDTRIWLGSPYAMCCHPDSRRGVVPQIAAGLSAKVRNDVVDCPGGNPKGSRQRNRGHVGC